MPIDKVRIQIYDHLTSYYSDITYFSILVGESHIFPSNETLQGFVAAILFLWIVLVQQTTLKLIKSHKRTAGLGASFIRKSSTITTLT